ncbi:MAG TPA: tyrosinase family protein [Candidatus Angelobacter sp.]|nr:tyrosinase family protein [Candidatus Angelobacter sp.]
MNRRQFVKSGTFFGAALALPRVPAVPAQPGTPTRKSIINMEQDAPDLINFERAVRIMRNLPEDNPRSWPAQARIHKLFCPHSNWWFLPWHRAFVHYFEQICRDVLRSPDFALPYWDWTRYPYIPSVFLNQDSALWQPNRHIDGSVAISFGAVGAPELEKILKLSECGDLFGSPTADDDQRHTPGSGNLESTPHTAVHQTVGGDLSGNAFSARDPLFWVHHCNVDRIWESWAELHGRAVPLDNLWAGHQLHEFYDPIQDKPVTVHAWQTNNSAQFGARYDSLETFFGHVPGTILPALQVFWGPGEQRKIPEGIQVIDELSLLSEPVKVAGNRAVFSIAATDKVKNLLDTLNPSRDGTHRLPSLHLLLDGVPVPKSPTTSIRVFLNVPGASVNTPFDDPGYITTVSFFGMRDPLGGDHREGNHTVNLSFNIIANVARLKAARRKITKTFIVTLLTVDLLSPKDTNVPEPAQPAKLRVIALG